MWLYIFAAVLVVLGLIGATLGGGIFTIVLIPIGLLIAVSVVIFGMWGRAPQGSAGGDPDPRQSNELPLPHSRPESTGRVPTSPEALADARRSAQ